MVKGKRHYPEIKVCGPTRPDEAGACADLGAESAEYVSLHGRAARIYQK